jgi:hypothetical protein
MYNFPDNRKISGFNFARICDFVFSESMTHEQFKIIDRSNIEILYNSKNMIYYKASRLILNDNDIIYTNPVDAVLLFKYLKNLKFIKNIVLVTSQTDVPVTKKLFEKKPKIISKWFATNVAYDHEDLVPIPLGIANNYSPKNLLINNFSSQKKDTPKIKKLYINMQKNTNRTLRGSIEEYFSKFEWVEIDEPNLTLEQYLTKLKQHKYILCPQGNGYDTHRIWESLYAGSTPVVLKNQTHSNLKNLPIIFVDKFEDLSLQVLDEEYEKVKNSNYRELDINYWKSEFSKIKNQEEKASEVIEKFKYYEIYYFKKRRIIGKILNFYKKVKYIFYQLTKNLKIKNKRLRLKK